MYFTVVRKEANILLIHPKLSTIYGLVVFTFLSVCAESQVRYRVVKLPSVLSSGDGLYLADINDQSGLVGVREVLNTPTQAFLLTKGTGIAFLPSLGGSCSSAMALNEMNHVVGNACLPGDEIEHAVLWQGKTAVDLDTFGGVASDAYGINNLDDTAGSFVLPDGSLHGFFWRQGIWTDVGTLGGSRTYAEDVNDSDAVTGGSDISNDAQPPFKIPPFHGFVWKAGVMTDFGSLFGSDFNYGSRIDSAGRVVGSSDLAGDTAAHGFVWDQGKIVQDLAPLPDNQIAWAFAMNSSGSIVGSSGLYDGGNLPPAYEMLCPCYAVLWEHGQAVRLNDVLPPGWTMDLAANINDRGEIIGTGMHEGDYREQNILLEPIRERNAPIEALSSKPYSGPTRIFRDRKGKLRLARR